MTIEIRKPFNKLFGNDYGVSYSTGIYVFRVATTIPMNVELAKNVILNHMRNEINNATNNNMREERKQVLLSSIDKIDRGQIIFFKQEMDNIYVEETVTPLNYYQFVIGNVEDMDGELSNVFYNYINNVYRQYEGNRLTAIVPLGDIVYQFAELSVNNGRNKPTTIKSSNEALNDKAIKKFTSLQNNIALSIFVDTDKQYNRNSIVKAKVQCYDNILEAFENKTKNTYNITCINDIYPSFTFILPRSNNYGNTYFSPCYTGNIKIDFYKDMLISYDGIKSRNAITPFLERLYNANIRMLDLIQFALTKDLFYGELYSDRTSVNKLVLRFINNNKVFMSKSNINVRGTSKVDGIILFLPKKGSKKCTASLRINYTSSPYGEAVIPVDNDNDAIQKKALDIIVSCIENNKRGSSVVDLIQEYKNCFGEVNTKKDDILSEWFEYCTKSIQNTDDRIIKAYLTMKKNLEKEYKEIGSYLNCYDFSRCSAIPKVSMDKKLKQNYYKTLHVEPKSIIIKSINNKKINPITDIQPTIKVMMTDRRKGYMACDFPLSKFIDTQANLLDLSYIKLKGEVNRVKTQNRR